MPTVRPRLCASERNEIATSAHHGLTKTRYLCCIQPAAVKTLFGQCDSVNYKTKGENGIGVSDDEMRSIRGVGNDKSSTSASHRLQNPTRYSTMQKNKVKTRRAAELR